MLMCFVPEQARVMRLTHIIAKDTCIESLVCLPCTGKLAGLDKKLSKSLDQEVQSTGTSPLQLSASPVGPLAESSRSDAFT